jgi:diguanylate cyclase (GGDEF)-like protein
VYLGGSCNRSSQDESRLNRWELRNLADMNQPTPVPPTHTFSHGTFAVVVACLLAVTHLVWSIARPSDHPLFLVALSLTVALILSTRNLWARRDGSSRLGLTHVSLAAVFASVCLRAWNASELTSRLSELCQVIFASTAILALIRLPRQEVSRLEQLRSGLDVATTMAASWVYAWHFLIARLLTREFDAWEALCLLRATLHPALVAVLVSTAFRAAVSRPAWPGIGLIAFVGADVFSILNEVGMPMPAMTENLWAWGAVCIVIASLQDQAQQVLEPDLASLNPSSTLELRAKLNDLARPLRQPRWVRALQLGGPFVTVALVYTLHLFEPKSSTGDLAEISLMVIVGLVLLRQTLAVLESRRLNRDLRDLNHAFDDRVEERTRALEESRLRLIANRRLDRDRNEVLELIARDEPVAAIRERLDRINDLDHYGLATQELLETTDRLNEIAEQRRELTHQLEHQATHDALTGLPNRLLGERLLERMIRDETAKPEPGLLGVLFLDLDRFKQINDTLGHSIGDQMLFSIAARLRRSLEPEQILIRTGGDEFALFVPMCFEADATRIANTLVRALETPFKIGQTELFVGASLGVAIYPEDGLDAIALQKHADIAMYHAKLEGVPVRRFSQRMIDAARERLRLETALRQELDRIARTQLLELNPELNPDLTATTKQTIEVMSNEHPGIPLVPVSRPPVSLLPHLPHAATTGFEVRYQPQVDVNTDTVSGFEALLRWNHPELGSVPPSKFIPIAEESGLIVPLGAWVLEQACQQNAAWQRAGLRAVKIAVNVSSLQFERPDFVTLVRGALQRSGLRAEYLELELTETVFGGQSEELVRRMSELRELGVHLSIDDFGTEYSSLRYLQRLPIDALKIDRSFTQGLELEMQHGSRSTLPLIQAIISLAKGFKMTVIAEGVEHEGVLEELRSQGCNIVQGFLFAQAVPPIDAAVLLASQRLTRQPEMLH